MCDLIKICDATQKEFLEIFQHDFELFKPHFPKLRKNAMKARYLFVIIENDQKKILFDKIFADKFTLTFISYDSFKEYNNGKKLPNGKKHCGGGFHESRQAPKFGFQKVALSSDEGKAIKNEFYRQHGLDDGIVEEIWVRREGANRRPS